jgi:flavin reductase (DIM6/NTAB) family NADH-FMN oxidoreductase RutF
MTIIPSEIPIPKLHEHLLHAVAPRPIAFVTTVDKEGNVNLAPFSFFNCFGSNPPVLVYSPALSGRTGQPKNTHEKVKEVPECVVNIAHYGILYQMNLAAGMYPKGVNEFAKSGLTAIASETVKPPRVAECYVQFECDVKQVIETGNAGSAGNLVVCEIKRIHINEAVLDAEGSIDPFKMDYIARMGKQFWARVGAENIIHVPSFKPASELGLGFDQLPGGIRNSKYLTGNEIAQIATMHAFPTQDEINEVAKADFIKEMIEKNKSDFNGFEKEAHQRAKVEITRGSMPLAFQILMLTEQKRHEN